MPKGLSRKLRNKKEIWSLKGFLDQEKESNSEKHDEHTENIKLQTGEGTPTKCTGINSCSSRSIGEDR